MLYAGRRSGTEPPRPIPPVSNPKHRLRLRPPSTVQPHPLSSVPRRPPSPSLRFRLCILAGPYCCPVSDTALLRFQLGGTARCETKGKANRPWASLVGERGVAARALSTSHSLLLLLCGGPPRPTTPSSISLALFTFFHCSSTTPTRTPTSHLTFDIDNQTA